MKKFIGLFLITFLLSSFLSVGLISAKNDQVNFEKVNPSNGFSYSLKRFKEKANLFSLFYSKEKKAEYMEKIVNKRLLELMKVIDEDQKSFIETASQRYYTNVGEYTEFLLRNKMVHKKDGAIKILSEHKELVSKLKEGYKYDSAEWMFVKHDEDYLNEYLALLDKIDG